MFTLNLVDDNIFMIIKKDALNGEFLKKLPIEVYGFIRVDVLDKKKFGMSFMNISQEVCDSEELIKLTKKAQRLALLRKRYH